MLKVESHNLFEHYLRALHRELGSYPETAKKIQIMWYITLQTIASSLKDNSEQTTPITSAVYEFGCIPVFTKPSFVKKTLSKAALYVLDCYPQA